MDGAVDVSRLPGHGYEGPHLGHEIQREGGKREDGGEVNGEEVEQEAGGDAVAEARQRLEPWAPELRRVWLGC